MAGTEQSPTQQLQPLHNGLLNLPEDLYDAADATLDSLVARHSRTTKNTRNHALFDAHVPSPMQPAAAIAAFRLQPDNFREAAFNDTADAGRTHGRTPTAADADAFTAALRQQAQTACQETQSTDVLLPFPGMHSLDLSTHLTQPAVHEAVQHLMEHPTDFLRAATLCPLSQVTSMLCLPVLTPHACCAVSHTHCQPSALSSNTQCRSVCSLSSSFTCLPFKPDDLASYE